MARPTLVSGSSRPLLLRMRPDLAVEQHAYLGRQYWVMKDPVAQKYYRFEEEEFALLQMLDGESSLEEIKGEFEQRFAPQKISIQELHQLVAMLHRSALVVSDAAGQGAELLKRHLEKRKRERFASLTNVLSIRFKGVDPDRLLDWLNDRIGWFFSLHCVLVCLAFAFAALLLVAVQFDVFQAKLPGFHEFFGSANWFWLAATLAVTKVLHEFGHGLTCKRFGGECHEMGFMLLVMTPCLYCNVSDSWMLPSKWRRAAIGAAGMYVEIVLATICTFLWWFTQPGLLNYLCLNVMFICSVSTLLFNANPLLRYDGYYILSDLIEIPNLRQKASTIFRRKAGAWFLGLPEPPDPFLPQRRQMFFALYSVAAAAYRWLVVLGILWFVYHVFEPYGLKVIGQMIACVALYGLLVQPVWMLIKFFHVPGRMDRVKKPRMFASLGAACLALTAVFLVPLPHHVNCSLYLQPRDAATVYVETPGRVAEIHVRPGDWVSGTQPLVTLENVDTEITILQLQGERDRLESKRVSLLQRSFDDDTAADEIDEVEQAIHAVDDQIANRRRDVKRLEITSPVTGCVIPTARVPEPPSDSDQLPSWFGTPLEPQNRNAFLDEGVAVCHIGDPSQLEAILAIDQGDMEFIREGQQVEIILEQLPGIKYKTEVRQLSQMDMDYTPQSLSAKQGGQLMTRTDREGREKPFSTTYQGSAPLEDDQGLLFVGATGEARIHAGHQTLAQRAWRYLCQTFNFDA